MDLQTLLNRLRSISEREHLLEILAHSHQLFDTLQVQTKKYRGDNPASYLEYHSLFTTHKTLRYFLDDLEEWNLTRRTENVPIASYKEQSVLFLKNLITILEKDLEYIAKLQEEYDSQRPLSFKEKVKRKLKKIYESLTKLFKPHNRD